MKLFQVVLSDGESVQKAGNVKFAPLKEEYAKTVADTVYREAKDWQLCISNSYEHTNDLYDSHTSSSSQSTAALEGGAVAGILVKGGHFAGAVLHLQFSHGGSMASYRDDYYCILHADGSISGKNEAGSSFTGEDSDSEDIDTYTLKNIYGNAPVEEDKQKEGIFVFEISPDKENACTLVGIEGEIEGALVIPQSLRGYAVRAIAPAICKGREDIESLVIPDSVEEIGEEAFAKCARMRSLVIGKGLRAVGDNGVYQGTGSFFACTGLETIEVHPENPHFRADGNCLIRNEKEIWLGTALNRDALILGCKNTDIRKAKKIYAIESFAFYGCEGLKKAVVPKSVYRIGRSAFEKCAGLEKAILFQGTDMETSISADAFYGCTSLGYVFIEKGLRWIEETSFEECPALREICYGGTEENWKKARTGYNHTPFLPVPVLFEQTPRK